MGGLGNQLFQVSTTLATAWTHGYTPCFHKISSSPSFIEPRPVYWNSIFHNLSTYSASYFVNCSDYLEQRNKVFSPITLEQPKIILRGYWQTEKYFVQYRDRLLSLFEPPKSLQLHIENLFSNLINEQKGAIVSAHLRLGDYLLIPDFLCLWKDEFKHYYTKAISHFSKEDLFMVFSDDIVFAKQFFKENFPKLKVTFPQEKDIIELYLMSKCDHHIIANSTFSWWGAWLNKKAHKVVISPLEWNVVKGKGVYFPDFIPSEWKTISVLHH